MHEKFELERECLILTNDPGKRKPKEQFRMKGSANLGAANPSFGTFGVSNFVSWNIVFVESDMI